MQCSISCLVRICFPKYSVTTQETHGFRSRKPCKNPGRYGFNWGSQRFSNFPEDIKLPPHSNDGARVTPKTKVIPVAWLSFCLLPDLCKAWSPSLPEVGPLQLQKPHIHRWSGCQRFPSAGPIPTFICHEGLFWTFFCPSRSTFHLFPSFFVPWGGPIWTTLTGFLGLRQWWKIGGPEETKVRYLLPGSLSARSLWHGYVLNQMLQLLLECPLLCLPGF